MLQWLYTVRIDPAADGGFIASVPAIPGCHTQGETLEETIKHAREAIVGMLVSYKKHKRIIPIEKQQTIAPPS